jgi:hypothetical protein
VPSVVIAQCREPAFDLRQRERLHVRCQAQRHLAQRQVDGRAARLALAQVEPGAQRAVAFAEIERQRDVAAQLAHVGARQVGVQRAAPVPPVARVAQQRLGEAAAQREPLAPFGGRRRIEPQLVPAQAVAHDQLHVGERQRRRVVLLVGPAQRAAADHELGLLEEPVGGAAVVAGARPAEVEAGDEHPPVGVAPRLELRPLDEQLLEAQLQGEQRARRQRGDDPRQLEGGPLLAVLQHDVAQLQRRRPAAGLYVDVANKHRNAQRLAGPLGDLRTPLVDVRQNPPVQCQPGDKQ